MKKKLLVGILPLLLLTGCGKGKTELPSSTGEEQGLKITLNESKITLSEEKTFQLVATLSEERSEKVTFSVRDSKIATVSEDGLVQALSYGNTQVVATLEDAVAVCEVEVTYYQPEDALSTEYTKKEFSLYVGESYPLPLTVRYGNKTIEDYQISYTIGNEEIISMEDKAIKALKAGESSLGVKVTYNGKECEDLLKVKVFLNA